MSYTSPQDYMQQALLDADVRRAISQNVQRCSSNGGQPEDDVEYDRRYRSTTQCSDRLGSVNRDPLWIGCGGFQWGVSFFVPKDENGKAPTGWVVVHITFKRRVFNCSATQSKEEKTDFYECFRIVNGDQVSEYTVQLNGKEFKHRATPLIRGLEQGIDTWGIPSVPSAIGHDGKRVYGDEFRRSFGTWEMNGLHYWLHELPDGVFRGEPDGVKQAGGLPSAATIPETLDLGPVLMRRFAEGSWNCCVEGHRLRTGGSAFISDSAVGSSVVYFADPSDTRIVKEGNLIADELVVGKEESRGGWVRIDEDPPGRTPVEMQRSPAREFLESWSEGEKNPSGVENLRQMWVEKLNYNSVTHLPEPLSHNPDIISAFKVPIRASRDPNDRAVRFNHQSNW
jgi:hypothetical protein